MSETVPDPVVQETPQPAPEPTQQVETPVEQQTAETPAEASPEPLQPKPRRADRHVANLTARQAALQAELAAAERRAEAAEALLAASKPETTQQPQRVETTDRAAIRAEIEFDDKRVKLVQAGMKEYPDWTERTDVLGSFGAASNPAFMQALVELPNAAKIVAALSDDTDQLVELLRKSPTAMAAQLGRMDAKMETAAAKPVSRAPAPAPKIEPANVVKEPDIYDENIDMKTWAKLWDKRAPSHLKGY